VQSTFDNLIKRAVAPASVRPKGQLTEPRTYGVYEIPESAGAIRRFRMGNHPIRMIELEQEFKRCKLLYLFRVRSDAVLLAGHFNGREA
jgi:hypothetical protein